MHPAAASFVADSQKYLRDTYVPRLQRALAELPEADLWWRPHDGVISIGTILLHLHGNVGQWIVSGLGGAPDDRDRAAEFAATSGPAKDELLLRLERTVRRACDVLAGLDEDALSRRHHIQGWDVTVQEAVYHVVEHFSWHVGQATWIAKARLGSRHGVSFYDDAQVNAAKNAE